MNPQRARDSSSSSSGAAKTARKVRDAPVITEHISREGNIYPASSNAVTRGSGSTFRLSPHPDMPERLHPEQSFVLDGCSCLNCGGAVFPRVVYYLALPCCLAYYWWMLSRWAGLDCDAVGGHDDEIPCLPSVLQGVSFLCCLLIISILLAVSRGSGGFDTALWEREAKRRGYQMLGAGTVFGSAIGLVIVRNILGHPPCKNCGK